MPVCRKSSYSFTSQNPTIKSDSGRYYSFSKSYTVSALITVTVDRSFLGCVVVRDGKAGVHEGDPDVRPSGKFNHAEEYMLAESRSTRFNREQAKAKLGGRVRSVAELSDVPKGATGRVMEMDEITRDEFELIVEWDVLLDGKYQHDWFSKDRYDLCLIDEPA